MTHPKIEAAIATFPATFGLRNHEGTFRISPESSYIAPGPFAPESQQRPVLYTQRLGTDGTWSDFAKGSPEELRREIVKR
jgi:hypothetical protein